MMRRTRISGRTLVAGSLALLIALSAPTAAMGQDSVESRPSNPRGGPLAFAEIDGATGEIVPGSAMNLSAENVSLGVVGGNATAGNICFHDLDFTPRNISATSEWQGTATHVNYTLGDGSHAGCPAGTEAVLVVRENRQLDQVSGSLTGADVMVLFH